MHAEAVALTGPDVRQVAVPAECRHLWKIDACFLAALVEQAELDTLGSFGKQRKVSADAVERSAQRIGRSGPDLHAHSD
jgi:hypothetical protein